MRITEDVLSDKLHDLIDTCEASKFAEIAGIAFGGECILAPWFEQPKDIEEENIYVFDPNENYRGELGESEYQTDDLEEE